MHTNFTSSLSILDVDLIFLTKKYALSYIMSEFK